MARESGVSLTTVSMVLNKGDQRISDATRDRVLEVIDRLGYKPSRLARGMHTRRSSILCVVVPELHHAFADVYFGELISGIHERAEELGYQIMLEIAKQSFVQARRHIELFEQCFIDGMLFIGSNDRHQFIEDMQPGRHHLILVNNRLESRDINYVKCDYRLAGQLAAQHLWELGHRRVAMIHGAPDVYTARELRWAFTDYFRRRDCELPPSRLVDGEYTEEGGEKAMRFILDMDDGVTAVFAGNDKMALGALRALHRDHRAAPQDLSVVGCDDIHQSAFVTPSLTTIRTPLYELGRLACERLVHLIQGKISRCQDYVPVELVERESSGPVCRTEVERVT